MPSEALLAFLANFNINAIQNANDLGKYLVKLEVHAFYFKYDTGIYDQLKNILSKLEDKLNTLEATNLKDSLNKIKLSIESKVPSSYNEELKASKAIGSNSNFSKKEVEKNKEFKPRHWEVGKHCLERQNVEVKYDKESHISKEIEAKNDYTPFVIRNTTDKHKEEIVTPQESVSNLRKKFESIARVAKNNEKSEIQPWLKHSKSSKFLDNNEGSLKSSSVGSKATYDDQMNIILDIEKDILSITDKVNTFSGDKFDIEFEYLDGILVKNFDKLNDLDDLDNPALKRAIKNTVKKNNNLLSTLYDKIKVPQEEDDESRENDESSDVETYKYHSEPADYKFEEDNISIVKRIDIEEPYENDLLDNDKSSSSNLSSISEDQNEVVKSDEKYVFEIEVEDGIPIDDFILDDIEEENDNLEDYNYEKGNQEFDTEDVNKQNKEQIENEKEIFEDKTFEANDVKESKVFVNEEDNNGNILNKNLSADSLEISDLELDDQNIEEDNMEHIQTLKDTLENVTVTSYTNDEDGDETNATDQEFYNDIGIEENENKRDISNDNMEEVQTRENESVTITSYENDETKTSDQEFYNDIGIEESGDISNDNMEEVQTVTETLENESVTVTSHENDGTNATDQEFYNDIGMEENENRRDISYDNMEEVQTGENESVTITSYENDETKTSDQEFYNDIGIEESGDISNENEKKISESGSDDSFHNKEQINIEIIITSDTSENINDDNFESDHLSVEEHDNTKIINQENVEASQIVKPIENEPDSQFYNYKGTEESEILNDNSNENEKEISKNGNLSDYSLDNDNEETNIENLRHLQENISASNDSLENVMDETEDPNRKDSENIDTDIPVDTVSDDSLEYEEEVKSNESENEDDNLSNDSLTNVKINHLNHIVNNSDLEEDENVRNGKQNKGNLSDDSLENDEVEDFQGSKTDEGNKKNEVENKIKIMVDNSDSGDSLQNDGESLNIKQFDENIELDKEEFVETTGNENDDDSNEEDNFEDAEDVTLDADLGIEEMENEEFNEDIGLEETQNLKHNENKIDIGEKNKEDDIHLKHNDFDKIIDLNVDNAENVDDEFEKLFKENK